MLSFLKYFSSLTVPNNSIADIIKNISFIPASLFSTTVAAFAAILYELIVCENAGKKENIDKNSDNNTAIIKLNVNVTTNNPDLFCVRSLCIPKQNIGNIATTSNHIIFV